MVQDDRGSRLAKLRSIPLFTDLTEDALDQVLDCATEFEVNKGHVLVQPNQAGEGLFVIEEGTAIIDLPDRKVELGPGEFIGDLALLDERAVHIARASAATPLTGLAIRREDFDRLLESHPKMAIAMLRTLARRLSEGTRSL